MFDAIIITNPVVNVVNLVNMNESTRKFRNHWKEFEKMFPALMTIVEKSFFLVELSAPSFRQAIFFSGKSRSYISARSMDLYRNTI